MADTLIEPEAQPIEVLIPEARHRHRLRLSIVGAIAAALALIAGVTYGAIGGSGSSSSHSGAGIGGGSAALLKAEAAASAFCASHYQQNGWYVYRSYPTTVAKLVSVQWRGFTNSGGVDRYAPSQRVVVCVTRNKTAGFVWTKGCPPKLNTSGSWKQRHAAERRWMNEWHACLRRAPAGPAQELWTDQYSSHPFKWSTLPGELAHEYFPIARPPLGW